VKEQIEAVTGQDSIWFSARESANSS